MVGVEFEEELVTFEPPAAPELQAVRIDKVSSNAIDNPVFMPNSNEKFVRGKAGSEIRNITGLHSGTVQILNRTSHRGNRNYVTLAIRFQGVHNLAPKSECASPGVSATGSTRPDEGQDPHSRSNRERLFEKQG